MTVLSCGAEQSVRLRTACTASAAVFAWVNEFTALSDVLTSKRRKMPLFRMQPYPSPFRQAGSRLRLLSARTRRLTCADMPCTAQNSACGTRLQNTVRNAGIYGRRRSRRRAAPDSAAAAPDHRKIIGYFRSFSLSLPSNRLFPESFGTCVG